MKVLFYCIKIIYANYTKQVLKVNVEHDLPPNVIKYNSFFIEKTSIFALIFIYLTNNVVKSRYAV